MANSEPVLTAIVSSPFSANTWNSSEASPPIAPESALTTLNSNPIFWRIFL